MIPFRSKGKKQGIGVKSNLLICYGVELTFLMKRTGVHNTNKGGFPSSRGVTKRCRLSWLTNSALVYEPKLGEGGGGLRGLSQ
jgi:hypothetical protein